MPAVFWSLEYTKERTWHGQIVLNLCMDISGIARPGPAWELGLTNSALCSGNSARSNTTHAASVV